MDMGTIVEGVIDFPLGKRYLSVNEDGSLDVVTRVQGNYWTIRYRECEGLFRPVTEGPVREDTDLHKKIKKLEEEGAFVK